MHIHFILVSPHTPENVGAACRAMKTMGFSGLRVVAPRCDLRDDMVYKLAHASYDILEAIEVFPDLAAALADCALAIACTANPRDVRADYHDLSALPELIAGKRDVAEHIAIVFGREDGGLNSQELRLCQLASSIPMATTYPSLNLAQAVMLYAYTLSPLNGFRTDPPPAEPLPFAPLKEKLDVLLDALNIWPRLAMRGRIIERVAAMKGSDMKLVHSLVSRMLNLLEKGRVEGPVSDDIEQTPSAIDAGETVR